MLEPRPIDPRAPKELKVKIATRLHVQLHSEKILRGKAIHSTVTEALEAYFARKEAEEQALRG